MVNQVNFLKCLLFLVSGNHALSVLRKCDRQAVCERIGLPVRKAKAGRLLMNFSGPQ